MPVATIALSAANITSSKTGLDYKRVQIAVADGTAAVADQSGFSLGRVAGVTSIEPDMASQGWLVAFEDGDIWTVVRTRGCGCGGSR